MKPDSSPQGELLDYLKKQIQEREALRDDIEKSIHILKEAERELRRHEPGPMAEAAEKAGQRARTETPEGSYHQQVEELLQEDQMLLLGMEDVLPRKKPPAPQRPPMSVPQKEGPPFLQDIDPAEEFDPAARFPSARAPSAGPGGGEAAPLRAEPSAPPGTAQAEKTPPSALGRLMDHIREGGANRCIDPWDRTCAAFVLRPDGPAIFATDVFLNYIRKVLPRLRRLHQEHTAEGEAPPPAAAALPELERRIGFLCSLVGALQGGRLTNLGSVPGLKMAGRAKAPEAFEFEKATLGVMHPRVLEHLHGLFQKPAAAFFLPGGPYSELAEYLTHYREFTRENVEEKRAASMLAQLGLARGPEAPGQATPPAPAEAESRAASETSLAGPAAEPSGESEYSTEEGEELQDLNTFDDEPEDKKSILAQEEDPSSDSGFRRAAQGFAGEGGEEGTPLELTEEDNAGTGPSAGGESPPPAAPSGGGAGGGSPEEPSALGP